MKTPQTVLFLLFGKHYRAKKFDDSIEVELWDGLFWNETRNPRAVERAKTALQELGVTPVSKSWRRPL
jgi:hypothetical protein